MTRRIGPAVPWSHEETAILTRLTTEGKTLGQILAALPGRNPPSIKGKRQALGLHVPVGSVGQTKASLIGRAGAPPSTARKEQEVETKTTHEGIEARSNGLKIKTVDDLLRHIEADMERFEIAASEATKWEVVTKDADDKAVVTPAFRVFVRLRPKAGPSTKDAVDSMLRGAFKVPAFLPAASLHRVDREQPWQVVIIADTHFGKLSWKQETGWADYDITIADAAVRRASAELIARGDREYKPGRRTIALLGDIFHYDTPKGETTSGTVLDRDGRIQKMIEVGTDAIIATIALSARTCATDVLVVPGNHDESLSWALSRILRERFRGDKRVVIDPGFQHRKTLLHGKTLLGFNHGDKVKKARLPGLLANEAPKEWGASSYREIHTGHFHQQTAEWQRPIETIDGVIVRIAPAICPADGWHAQNGYVASPRGLESYFYRPSGGLAGMTVASPDFPATGAKAA